MNDVKELLFHKKQFCEHLTKKEFWLSSYSFVYIFLWKDFFRFEFKYFDKSLCVFAKNETGCFLYLPPLGKTISHKSIEGCFDYMHSINGNNGVSRIENVEKNDLQYFSGMYPPFEKSCEYVYAREDIAQLKGNKYKSKRSAYNHFQKNNSYQCLPYDPAMKNECLVLFDQWVQDRKKKHCDDVYHQMLDENRGVHSLGLDYFQELGLIGRVVVVDGEIKAYSFGHPLNDDMFCVLFEVADLNLKGLPVFIFSEFCKDRKLKPYPLINVMDDFCMAQIKVTKESFYPVKKIQSFVINEVSYE